MPRTRTTGDGTKNGSFGGKRFVTNPVALVPTWRAGLLALFLPTALISLSLGGLSAQTGPRRRPM